MANTRITRITRVGWIAIGLAVLGSLVAIVNEIVRFRRTGAVDLGNIALIIAVPTLMYVIVPTRRA